MKLFIVGRSKWVYQNLIAAKYAISIFKAFNFEYYYWNGNCYLPIQFLGVVFHPLPLSKRMLSIPGHLGVFAQLLLSNEVRVVESAASLLRTLVEGNLTANSKLYLTGAFFFICRYPGNNFLKLAQLLEASHLNQSFHDSTAFLSRLGHNAVFWNESKNDNKKFEVIQIS